MLVNGLFRIGYGIGGVFAPGAMARGRLAADTESNPEARLFVRGFSAHQIAVAAVWLAGERRPALRGAAIALAIGIDAADMASAAVEARARGRWDPDLVGGFLFSAAGLGTAAAALRAD